jgi:hypothetical protein
MRGRVCLLQLLLVFTSAVILGSESRGTRDHILLSQIRDCHHLEGQVPVFISPGTGWPTYTPRHWVPFPSPPAIRMATVEVFEPASPRGPLLSIFLYTRIASARTTYKKQLPAIPLVFRAYTLSKKSVHNAVT